MSPLPCRGIHRSDDSIRCGFTTIVGRRSLRRNAAFGGEYEETGGLNVAGCFTTELTLPNDPRGLDLARAHVHALADLAELQTEEDDALVDAVLEGCANVLDHAFEPGEKGTYFLRSSLSAIELVVSIHDQGLPFDPEAVPEEVQEQSRAKHSASDGLSMIRRAVDQAQWISHGRAGKELRLVKRRHVQDVTQALSEADLEQQPEDAPLAPEQEYEIRTFRPEDALGISRCVYRVYGNSYMIEDAYYPDRIIRHNETGEFVSIVAVDESGEIVGHYALERPGLKRVAERGIAIVSPAHRGRDLMGRMRVVLEQEAERLGLAGVYSVAVTKHVFSQRVNEEWESRVCGIFLGGGPSSLVFKKIGANSNSGPLPQRMSWVVYYTYVGEPIPAVIHCPPRHRAIVERIYRELKAPVEFREEGSAPVGHGEVDVSYSQTMDSGTIRVRCIGSDTSAEIRRARRDLVDVTGAEHVTLELPLAQSGCAALAEAAESDGFFFLGVLPSYSDDGDTLLLQYLHTPLDISQIQVANAFARELVEYADRERARVSR
jgi:anti-sigma regulatory factor (Ser/Thr protein kinase)